MRFVIMLLVAVVASSAVAQTPAFDPKSWKGEHAGPPTRVLTVGSAHLAQMEKPVTADMLVPLLDKLAAFKPDIITHEGLSGEQCDHIQRYEARYPDIFKTYCREMAETQNASELSVAAAMAEIEKTLSDWPANPSAAKRRRLASLFIAAGDRPSAQVQWLYLQPSERREGDGINTVMLKALTRSGAKPNETYEIVVPLAVRLGLQRVYAVDDHTADSIQGQASEGFGAAIQQIWNAPRGPELEGYLAATKEVGTTGDFLEYFRFLNRPQTQRIFIDGDFGVALEQDTPELYGRQYVAWYETRNLRMVANVRAAFGNRPGARVLNIVGASHKPYYDAYLDMIHEVELVDVQTVLK